MESAGITKIHMTTRPLRKAGRKPKPPPNNAAQRITVLAADGFSIIGVAKGLGTSQDTLRKWFDEYPDLQAAFDLGREQERHALHNKLYRLAMEDGNASAAMFLLKARHGYREGDQGEAGNRVSINFTLPGALAMNEFQVIQHGNTDNRAEPISAKRLTRT